MFNSHVVVISNFENIFVLKQLKIKSNLKSPDGNSIGSFLLILRHFL